MTPKLTNLAITGAALAMLVPAALSTPAHAASSHTDVVTTLLRDGNNAGRVRRGDDGRDRPGDQYYPGSEHTTMRQLATPEGAPNGEILIFAMATYEIDGQLPNHRMQLLCSSVSIDPTAGPTLNAMKYVTNNDGNRYRNANHPESVLIDGGKAVAVYYNYAPGNRARRYVQVFGPGCTQLAPQTEVMAKNDDDCSETHGNHSIVITEQTDTYTRLISADGCNGNGRDDAWVNGVRIDNNGDGTYSVKKEFDVDIESQEERHRGTIFIPAGSQNLAVECGTAGNNQPPRRGIRCYGIDTSPDGEQGENANSRLIWRQYIERYGDEDAQGNFIHPTQVRFAPMLDAEGKATDAVLATWQRIEGRRRRGKGSAKAMIAALKFSRDGMEMMSAPAEGIFPASDATHASMCSTMWGTTGSASSKAFLISSSVNGSTASFARAAVVNWDGTKAELDSTVGLRAAIDNAWLPNIYGNNPNTQGRNFISCTNIANPGYGVAGGFMSDVKSFVGIPANTRRMDSARGIPEDKLALELVLVPAIIDAAPEPSNPDDGTNPDNGGNPDDGTNPDDGSNPDNGNAGNSGNLGAGCNVPGSGSGAGTLALIGLFALVAFRRRRRSL